MLIFFMVSTTFLREAELQVTLPDASAESEATPVEPLELTINRQGKFFLNGRPLVNDQLDTIRRAVEQALGDRPSESQRLVIRADSRAEHRMVVRALDAVGRAGVSNVGIATVPRGE